MVVGAGLGLRYGGKTPKPALKVTGRTLMVMSIEAMAAGGCTDAVVVVNDQVAKQLGPELAALPIPVKQVPGGASRQESVYNGLKAVRDDERLSHAEVVLVHDAVRPMVPAKVVSAVIEAVQGGAEAVAPAIPVADSMRILDPGGGSAVIDRSLLRAIQTPQGFDLGTIAQAHALLVCEGLEVTDDAAACEHAGHAVVLVEGARESLKVTEPLDLVFVEAIARAGEREVCRG